MCGARPGCFSRCAPQSRTAFRADRFLRCLASFGCAARACAGVRVARERLARCGLMSFTLQSAAGSARSLRRSSSAMRFAALGRIALSLLTGSFRCLAFSGRAQLDSRTPRFRQADRDGLLSRASAMLALPDVVHFFANELSRLSAGRLAFPRILPGALHRFRFRHVKPPAEIKQFRFRYTARRVTDAAGNILRRALCYIAR